MGQGLCDKSQDVQLLTSFFKFQGEVLVLAKGEDLLILWGNLVLPCASGF